MKESAAINQILGRRWHGLSREEQAKYYEKAREERQKHMALYPNWNARDNYGMMKKKKRKKEKSVDGGTTLTGVHAKGCDASALFCPEELKLSQPGIIPHGVWVSLKE